MIIKLTKPTKPKGGWVDAPFEMDFVLFGTSKENIELLKEEALRELMKLPTPPPATLAKPIIRTVYE